jgi:hypothetical protein
MASTLGIALSGIEESQFDLDALNFISAAGITSITERYAINNLVVDLKTTNDLWNSLKAIYPMVGGTSTSCKFNLKDPRDLDAAFRITFSGGWTFSSTGAQPNGTNSSGNTYYNPYVEGSPTSSSLSWYSRTNSAYAGAEMGSQPGDGKRWLLLLKYPTGGGNGVFESQFNNTGTGNANVELGATTTLGLFMGTRTSATFHRGLRQGVQIVSNTQTMTDDNPNANVTFGSFEGLYSNRECAFASIGEGIFGSVPTTFNTIVQKFNTTLGRAV